MSKRGDKIKDAVLRARVRQMMAAGFSVSRISKETGKSLVHVGRIMAQEQDQLTPNDKSP